METPSLVLAISKLAVAGDFTLEQMIELLDNGLTVEGLLDLIQWRLRSPAVVSGSRGCWVC